MKLIWIQLALGLFQTDLAVKHEIDNNPEFEKEHMLPGGRVQIKRLRNYGMAGGHFSGNTGAIIRGSGFMTLGCAGSFLVLLSKKGHEIQKLGFALLTGGALSNLYDRCRKGYVVDYVSFPVKNKKIRNIVFNISDFCIMIGALLIVLGSAE